MAMNTADHLRDAGQRIAQTRIAAGSAYASLRAAYQIERTRYYQFLRDDDARDWVVLLEPEFTIPDAWVDGLGYDDLIALRRKVERVRNLCDHVDAILAQRSGEYGDEGDGDEGDGDDLS